MVVYDDKILEALIVEKRNGFHILAMRKKYLYIMKQREILTFLTKKGESWFKAIKRFVSYATSKI